MTDTKFGGCPSCGKASCVARACQELSPEDIALLEKRLEAFAPFARALQSEKNPPGEGLPFGIIDPDYAKFFTIARIIAWQHGYALTMHGSFTRDLDLVLIPWTPVANDPTSVVLHLASSTDTALQDKEPAQKEHGRLCWSLLFKGFTDPRWVDLSFMPRVAKAQADSSDESSLQFTKNELTALSNSPVALMALVNWWHCRETEDSAFAGENVDYKPRREELTARAKAIVEQDPDCWPSDLTAELGLSPKAKGVKHPDWYPIDGDLRGYDGDIVVKHKDGSHRVGATNWISSHKVKTPRGAMACWQSCLKDGYVSWTPLG